MLYRITLDMAFTLEDPPNDILDKVLDHWAAAQPINPGHPNQEPAFICIQQCHHDETPPLPCVITYYIQKPPPP